MANPSPNDLIAANFIIWGDNGKAPSDATTLQLDINGAAFSDPNLADWQPFALSSQNPQWAAHGMYAAAFKTSNGIVIAFQGTDLKNWAEVSADLSLVAGNTKVLQDAKDFALDVWKKAGIPASQIFVTGHSLGGAEAQYVQMWSQLNGTPFGGGATFGAPGIPGYVKPTTGAQPNLVNYVDYGDPVGNHASDAPTFGIGKPLTGVDHVGPVKAVGSLLDSVTLGTAVLNVATLSTLLIRIHPLEHYEQDLNSLGLNVSFDPKSIINRANLVRNGSFEQGPNPGAYLPLQPGSTAITGWAVIKSPGVPASVQGGIDYVGTDWVSADGNRSLDLNGTPGVGGVAQTFATVPGQTYNVSFGMAGHYSGLVQSMEVTAAGQSLHTTFQSGTDRSHLGWTNVSWNFAANAPQTTLQFYSLQTDYPYGGPALDNVVVKLVPPTATPAPTPTPTPTPAPTTVSNPAPGTFVTLGGQSPAGGGGAASASARAMFASAPSQMSFLTATGIGQSILAQASGETLVGSSQFEDTFQGTSEALNGDLIKVFGGNDVIDITDLDFGRATLSYSGATEGGTLNLSDGVHSAGITLAGDFRQANFHLATDLQGGTNITYG